VLILPALWAFAYGYLSRDLSFTPLLETTISQGVLLVIPGAFILIGMRISTLQKWRNLRSGIFPTIFRILIVPGLAGLLLTLFGVHGDTRLVLVLMSSMPTAFSSLILAEEYDLDRQVTASSILLSILALPIAVLLWLTIF
jgi:predicted permease